jgi:hypothetical protein
MVKTCPTTEERKEKREKEKERESESIEMKS